MAIAAPPGLFSSMEDIVVPVRLGGGRAGGPRQRTGARRLADSDHSAVDDQVVEQLDRGVPTGLGVSLAGVERLSLRTEDVLLDDGVVRALELSRNTLGPLGEDRAGRSTVEELVRGRVSNKLVSGLDRARECASGLESTELLLGLGQPAREGRSGLLVLGGLRDCEEGTAPVGGAARED